MLRVTGALAASLICSTVVLQAAPPPKTLPAASVRFLTEASPPVGKEWRADFSRLRAAEVDAWHGVLDLRLLEIRERYSSSLVTNGSRVTNTADLLAISRGLIETQPVERAAKPSSMLTVVDMLRDEAQRRLSLDGGDLEVLRKLVAAGDLDALVTEARKRSPATFADKAFAPLAPEVQQHILHMIAAVPSITGGNIPLPKELSTGDLIVHFSTLSTEWVAVVEAQKKLTNSAKIGVLEVQSKLEEAQRDLESKHLQLEDAAQGLRYGIRVADAQRQEYLEQAASLLRDEGALQGLVRGLIPPEFVAAAGDVSRVAVAAQAMIEAGGSMMQGIESAASSALTEFAPALEELVAAGLTKELGLNVPVTEILAVAKGGDPVALLAGPVLEAVGLPPALGGIAVGLATGNFIGAAGGLANLAGISLGGMFGGGTSVDPQIAAALAGIQAELGAIRKELAEINQRLARIEEKIDTLHSDVERNHAEVMARLEVLGNELATLRELSLRSLLTHTASCNKLLRWTTGKERLDYSALRITLNNEKADVFRDCWGPLTNTASGPDVELFTLAATEGVADQKDSPIRTYLAPHIAFFKSAFPTTKETRQRAVLFLGHGLANIDSVRERAKVVIDPQVKIRRVLLEAEVLNPKHIIAAAPVRAFVDKMLVVVGLRPFVNLTGKSWVVELSTATSEARLLPTDPPNRNQITLALSGTLELIETAVAQAALFDGDIMLPHAVEVLERGPPTAQEHLSYLMERNPVLAANVAHLFLRSLFERRPLTTDVLGTQAAGAGSKAGVSSERRRLSEEASRTAKDAAIVVKDPGGLSVARASSYAFAVASGSPDMLAQLFARPDGTPPVTGLEFFRRSSKTGSDSCKRKLWDGVGLFVKMPNGVCTPVPTPVDFANGSLVRSAETIVLSEARRRIVQELVMYQARLDAHPEERAVLDRWLILSGSPID